jgi:hypothetical protein
MSGSVGSWIVAGSVFLVALVLLAGLVTMLRGGDPRLTQRLMRWRVGLQFGALVIILMVLWLRQHPGF